MRLSTAQKRAIEAALAGKSVAVPRRHPLLDPSLPMNIDRHGEPIIRTEEAGELARAGWLRLADYPSRLDPEVYYPGPLVRDLLAHSLALAGHVASTEELAQFSKEQREEAAVYGDAHQQGTPVPEPRWLGLLERPAILGGRAVEMREDGCAYEVAAGRVSPLQIGGAAGDGYAGQEVLVRVTEPHTFSRISAFARERGGLEPKPFPPYSLGRRREFGNEVLALFAIGVPRIALLDGPSKESPLLSEHGVGPIGDERGLPCGARCVAIDLPEGGSREFHEERDCQLNRERGFFRAHRRQ